MTPAEVKQRIESGIDCHQVNINEFSGGTDHYSVEIVSDDFIGLNSLKRHRLVMGLFRAELETEEVHALALKTFTVEQSQNQNN